MAEQLIRQAKMVGAGLVGALVGGAAVLVLMPRAPASAPVQTSAGLFAPPPARSSAVGAPLVAELPMRSVPAASPAPILSADFRTDDSAGASPAPSSAAPGKAASRASAASGAAPKLIATGSDDVSASASGAAVASAASSHGSAPQAAAGRSSARAKPSAAKDPLAASVAATVRYGSADRAELMGRAAGPIYNFGAVGEKGDPIAAAVQQVDAAQQQMQSAPGVSAADQTALTQQVGQVHNVAYQAEQAVQAATPATTPAPAAGQ
jgi:hypothetical protein